jgi:glycosyltransferase involved in cell wall biosynthesis
MVLHGYFPDEPRVAAEARAAIDAGMAVDILTLRRPGEPATETIEGVRLQRLPIEHRRGGGLVRTVFEYLAFTLLASTVSARMSFSRRYDVVHVHNPPDFLVLAGVGPRLRGAKVVFDVHDLASDMFAMRFERLPGSGLVDRALRFVERRAALSAAAVLTVHEPYRDELVARGVPGEKVTVLMNSLDERLLPEAAAPGMDGFRIVYHGTITPHYGVELIIRAAGRIRDEVPGMRVDLYGDGDGVPAVLGRARKLGIESAVSVSGYLPQRDVLHAVRGASVGVVPNLPTRLNRFALSTKLLEYVALGIPVVSADLPTIRAHFTDHEIRFFRAGDDKSLADALAEVAADPDVAQRRARAARARYEHYRWHNYAREYVDLVRRLAG